MSYRGSAGCLARRANDYSIWLCELARPLEQPRLAPFRVRPTSRSAGVEARNRVSFVPEKQHVAGATRRIAAAPDPKQARRRHFHWRRSSGGRHTRRNVRTDRTIRSESRRSCSVYLHGHLRITVKARMLDRQFRLLETRRDAQKGLTCHEGLTTISFRAAAVGAAFGVKITLERTIRAG